VIQCRLVSTEGAPWRTARVRAVSAHEKQKPDTEEESGASRGHGSDSIPRTCVNRCRRGNAVPILCFARFDRSAGF